MGGFGEAGRRLLRLGAVAVVGWLLVNQSNGAEGDE
uniref:Uncharacterized protein n=1 Tax=Arundo donax TaxID=35708 RepID=A0A0A9A1Z1_ARUDO